MSSQQIGMLYDRIRPEERLLIEAFEKKGVNLKLRHAEDLVFATPPATSEVQFEEVVLQRCVGYFRSLHSTALLESKGTTVINSLRVATICGNKLLTSLALAKKGIPTPRTMVAFTTDGAMKALDQIGYPAVLKPVTGSWGRLIAPMKDPESARAILESREFMFPLYQVYYLQEMIEKPSRDIRCFIVGEKAIAAIYRYSPPGEWRTNTARGGRAENCEITPEMGKLSLEAAEAVGGGVLGVDLMETASGLVVHEVNYSIEFRNTIPATGVDIPSGIVE